MHLKYRDISETDSGVLCEILTRSYQSLKDLDEYPWIPGDAIWQEYDDRIFDNPGNKAEYVFLTEMDRRIVGFASFTHEGTTATIGRNSVLPGEGGKGIGTGQVSEVIRRCAALGIRTIGVVTGTHRFFAPAQKMYLRAGLNEVDRFDDGEGVGRVFVKYELELEAERD